MSSSNSPSSSPTSSLSMSALSRSSSSSSPSSSEISSCIRLSFILLSRFSSSLPSSLPGRNWLSLPAIELYQILTRLVYSSLFFFFLLLLSLELELELEFSSALSFLLSSSSWSFLLEVWTSAVFREAEGREGRGGERGVEEGSMSKSGTKERSTEKPRGGGERSSKDSLFERSGLCSMTEVLTSMYDWGRKKPSSKLKRTKSGLSFSSSSKSLYLRNSSVM
mmetsp:Transcript_47019/g.78351  ORF Transcript_47019/g.78351 Transcript_47019/m.78351 type:complete len:222 (-) Transcript_47019:677-1342(-)